MSKLVTQAAAAVKKAMEGEGSGHDWWHVWRAWRLAERVARTEPRADATVVALGALLHDLGDWKFHGGDEEAAPREAGTARDSRARLSTRPVPPCSMRRASRFR